MRRPALIALTVGVVAAATGLVPATAAAATSPVTPSGVRHVVVVVLENTSYKSLMNKGRSGPARPKDMPYLASLAARGVTLDRMYATDHDSLTNYVAMTSGHSSNAKTRDDCPDYDCVYPPGRDDNIADQLEARGLTWKAYMDGMQVPCQKPGTRHLRPSRYVTRHNPFMYYESIVGDAARCAEHVVPFRQLVTDLVAGELPSYAFVSPDTCHDAHDGGKRCGLAAADRWLEQNVAPVVDSPEFRDGGVLIVTFDEGTSDASCCGLKRGGGHIGTFVVSPMVATAGGRTSIPYSQYSLLRWVEDAFGLPCLRHACDDGVKPFGTDVLKAP